MSTTPATLLQRELGTGGIGETYWRVLAAALQCAQGGRQPDRAISLLFEGSDSLRCLGEGMIPSESRVRDIRPLGSPSGERNRGQGGD